ncbi:MAG TPA: type II and III secretion system protein family protein [Vicinamibacterales bacterium]|nr:type II and III secretion system protein family protein [Vicinamibacterales bacterium]
MSLSMLMLLTVAGLGAQQPQPKQLPQVSVTAGRSTIVSTEFDVTRIAVTNPEVADATVVRPREILIDGKAAGTISLILWGDNTRVQYDIVVEQPVTALEQQLHRLFPDETVEVTSNADGIVLSGRASSTQVMLRIAEVVRAASPKANVINMLQVPGGSDAQQVMLQVRIAEVNRKALMEFGTSFFTGATGAGNWIGRGTTGQFGAPEFSELSRSVTTGPGGRTTSLDGKIEFSDFLNIFLFNTSWNAGTLIRALKQTGYFQSLAEPNLIAYNNKEASFLAGGEFPIPIVNGVGQVSIEYKEFGVRLNFTPTIAGDLIRLKVRPEVSELDFNNGITMEGFRIPALQVRRAETEVELRDGQSFAVAGLIDNTAQTDKSAIPLLSQVPIIGHLFASKADRQERTELLVLITPRLVRPLNPDEVPALPTLPGRFLPPGDDVGGRLEGGGGTVDAPPAR